MPMQEKYSEVVPLRVTPKMYRALKTTADKEYISMAQYLRRVLREALRVKEER
jgi:hypothetical protein